MRKKSRIYFAASDLKFHATSWTTDFADGLIAPTSIESSKKKKQKKENQTGTEPRFRKYGSVIAWVYFFSVINFRD